MKIDRLLEMPKLEKQDNGDYYYPDQYVGKVYEHEDMYYIFDKKRYTELSKTLVDVLTSMISYNIIDKVREEITDKIVENINVLFENMETLNENINSLDENKNVIDNGEVISQCNELISISLEDIKSDLNDFKQEQENLKTSIKEALTAPLKQQEDKQPKLDPMNLAMFKKLGLDIKEIIDLAKNGVI
jgi:hypothetical protein